MIKILAGISLALGAYIAVFNWRTINTSDQSDRNVSSIPLFGALFLCLGLLGFQPTRPYAWAGILADFGTLSLLVVLPILAWESWTTSRFNRLHRFHSNANGRRDDIQLFKRGKFTISTEYHTPVACNAQGALVVSQGRVGTWRKDGDAFLLEGYGEDRMLRIKKQGEGFVTEEENYPDSNEYQHDRMGGLALKRLP